MPFNFEFFNSVQRCTALTFSLKCARCAAFALLLLFILQTHTEEFAEELQLLCFLKLNEKAPAIACLIAFTFTLLQILNKCIRLVCNVTEVLKSKPRRRLQKLRTLRNSPTQNLKQALGFATALIKCLANILNPKPAGFPLLISF